MKIKAGKSDSKWIGYWTYLIKNIRAYPDSRVIIALLSTACLACFVIYFVQCVQKFSSNPEHSEIKYKPSRNQPFPSFTLCPHDNSSKIFEDMQVQTIDIRTYNDSKKQHIFQARNWTLLDWTVAIIKQKEICYTFTVPEDIRLIHLLFTEIFL